MSEPRQISPMLDNFLMGSPVSNHDGIRCCPAIEKETDDRYIVKIISVPAAETQLDALLLTGAYPDEASALAYFKDTASNIVDEVRLLQGLSEQDGFLPFEKCQVVPMESGKGYEVYLLSAYRRTLEKHFQRHTFTHLDALNLGLDLCAALSVSRRSGYLYVDLKPSNVYVTENQYKIGDLGFISAESIKYQSLPERYRSEYTPGEISDAYSSLNTTMDIYAAGMILYRAYNGGELPFNDDILPGDRLPAPAYADSEMSQIILKACDPNPYARWRDPAQLGQAIIEYMQHNAPQDTPIVPICDAESPKEETATEDHSEAQPEIPAREEIVFTEDEFGNLSILSVLSAEELEITDDPETYAELSGEVSEMLSQADALAHMDVPKPVVVPDHIDLPVLPTPETEQIASDPAEQTQDEESSAEIAQAESASIINEESIEQTTGNKRRGAAWIIAAAALLLAFIIGGILFYNNYYLIPVNGIKVVGAESSVTVYVDTTADETLLQILCADTYGNQTPAPLVDGKAEFHNLIPNTAYTIKLVTSGFHKLVGNTTIAYSTPIQTNIVQFDAINGISNGSVVLNIAVEGPDGGQWQVIYSADGEEERTATFTAHRVMITDLTIGKEYNFRLTSTESLYLTGQKEIHFTPMKIIRAENAKIISCIDNTLTVKWDAPESENITGWIVSCTGGNYSQTISTTDTTVTFRDLDHTAGYTVEVKANYMSVGEKISIPANTATVTNMSFDTTSTAGLRITWDTSIPVPAEGWMLHYTVVGIDNEKGFICGENSAIILNSIPNATYRIWLTDTKGNPLLSSETEVTTGQPVDYTQTFDTISVNRADMEFQMCKTLSLLDWNGGSTKNIEFTTSFTSGQAASFLVKLLKESFSSEENIAVMYVIRSANGTPIYTNTVNGSWSSLWNKGYCKLYIPAMPTEAGTYTAEIYFNNGLVTSQAFSIT